MYGDANYTLYIISERMNVDFLPRLYNPCVCVMCLPRLRNGDVHLFGLRFYFRTTYYNLTSKVSLEAS